LGVNACLIQRIRLGIEFPLRDLQELGQIDFLAAFADQPAIQHQFGTVAFFADEKLEVSIIHAVADQFFPGTCVRSLPLTEMNRLFSHSRDGSS
jgi:hypothetical protein